MGYSPWGCKESDINEQLTHTQAQSRGQEITANILPPTIFCKGFPHSSVSKESAWNAETQVQFLGQEDLLEKEIATYSIILAWRILRTEEPGWLQSMGSQESDTT